MAKSQGCIELTIYFTSLITQLRAAIHSQNLTGFSIHDYNSGIIDIIDDIEWPIATTEMVDIPGWVKWRLAAFSHIVLKIEHQSLCGY